MNDRMNGQEHAELGTSRTVLRGAKKGSPGQQKTQFFCQAGSGHSREPRPNVPGKLLRLFDHCTICLSTATICENPFLLADSELLFICFLFQNLISRQRG